jgi:long chain fatty acid CoA FadD26
MPEIDDSITSILALRARQQPDESAYTFIDYEADPAGLAETLTWSELHQRAQVVAATLLKHGAPGDRAVILAPQSMEYVVGLYGAILAGFIAAPLTVPMFGQHDERIVGALKDCLPTVVLTTSTAAASVADYIRGAPTPRPPRVIEVDTLDFYSPVTGPPLPAAVPTKMAYLQYTSGSTRQPAGVAVTHHNVIANLDHALTDFWEAYGKTPPPDMTAVSWLPLYHDMGLLVGIFIPLVAGRPSVLMSPVAFLQKPARWIQQLASHPSAFTAAPNFAYELAAGRCTDEDLAGLDLSGVKVMINGAERVLGSTVRRFAERFAPFGLSPAAMRPSYGLAEATVYVVSSPGGQPPTMLQFDIEKLAAGHAERCADGGTAMVGVGAPRSTGQVRIVDPETFTEKPADELGEIWLHGEHVTPGYWHNPELTARVYGGQLVTPSEGTPAGPWLRTGDLGLIFEGELFIIGRIKDLLIIDGRNIYPDDIEATVIDITRGRVAAVSVPDDSGEKLVVLAELRTYDKAALPELKSQVTAMVSRTHAVRVAEVVLLESGSLPITTSGKVRRSASLDRYRSGRLKPLEGGS